MFCFLLFFWWVKWECKKSIFFLVYIKVYQLWELWNVKLEEMWKQNVKNLTIVLFFYNFSSFSFYFSVVCVICIAFFYIYIYLIILEQEEEEKKKMFIVLGECNMEK